MLKAFTRQCFFSWRVDLINRVGIYNASASSWSLAIMSDDDDMEIEGEEALRLHVGDLAAEVVQEKSLY